MKILCCYTFDWEKEYIQKQLAGHDFVFVRGTIRDCSPMPDPTVDGLCVFIDSPITSSVFSKFPNLKFIATRSSGFDHIDTAVAKKRDIVISNVPAYGKYAVAEYTFALMLSLSRKIYQACNLTRQGIFADDTLMGFDLNGKILGVVGTGAIGSQVIQIAKAFGMQVIACDAKPDQARATNLGFTYVALDELLKQADIVTLHVCYNQSTHHLINSTNISSMRAGSYLINTSRGQVIETMALVKGIEEKILAGVALDVFEEEAALVDQVSVLADKKAAVNKLQTLVANYYLAHHPRVLASPHNAYNSIEARRDIWDVTAGNIKAFAAGKPVNVAVCD